MICESRVTPEDTPAFAAAATALIDDHLARFGETARAAYWNSVRMAYNAPYNEPVAGKRQQVPRPSAVTALGVELTAAAEAALESAAALAQSEPVTDLHAA